MAEADVLRSDAARRYFCHQCSKEVTPKLPDIVCSLCDSGFIEEIAENAERTPVQEQGGNAHSSYDDDHEGRHDPDRDVDESSEATASSRLFPDPRGRQSTYSPRVTHVFRAPASSSAQSITDIFNVLLNGFASGGAFAGMPIQILHGNPGDYAWGVDGLDTIITRLLNNMDASGPPAADKSRIASLPTVRISPSQVGANLQCSVCFDEFVLDAEAMVLPCKHHYHKDCIVKWLEMHGTCPVCRKDLNGTDTSTQEYGLAQAAESIGGGGQAANSASDNTEASGSETASISTASSSSMSRSSRPPSRNGSSASPHSGHSL